MDRRRKNWRRAGGQNEGVAGIVTEIVCAGVATVDVVFSTDEQPSRPIKYRAATSDIRPGGCALNAALAASRLGGKVHLAAAIGDDVFGDLVREAVAAAGVVTDLLVVLEGVPTSRSAVLVGPDGERMIVNHRDPRLFDAEPAFAAGFGHDGALGDTRWPAGAARALAGARSAGRPAVLDVEAPVAPARAAMAAATHLAFSEQGLEDTAGQPLATTADQAGVLASVATEQGVWACVTRGERPVLCHDGTALTEVPAFPVHAVDTLGAGDVWHGAFALFLAAGTDALAAVRRANAVAAIKTSGWRGLDLAGTAAVDDFLRAFS